MTGTSQVAQTGAISAMMRSGPRFCRPIEFSMPEGVSATRGCGFPARGSGVTPFETTAPSRFTSNCRANSIPQLNVPEAGITGLRRLKLVLRSGASSTASCGVTGSVYDACQARFGAGSLRPDRRLRQSRSLSEFSKLRLVPQCLQMPWLKCPLGVAIIQWCVHVPVAARCLLACMSNPVGFCAPPRANPLSLPYPLCLPLRLPLRLRSTCSNHSPPSGPSPGTGRNPIRTQK